MLRLMLSQGSAGIFVGKLKIGVASMEEKYMKTVSLWWCGAEPWLMLWEGAGWSELWRPRSPLSVLMSPSEAAKHGWLFTRQPLLAAEQGTVVLAEVKDVMLTAGQHLSWVPERTQGLQHVCPEWGRQWLFWVAVNHVFTYCCRRIALTRGSGVGKWGLATLM